LSIIGNGVFAYKFFQFSRISVIFCRKVSLFMLSKILVFSFIFSLVSAICTGRTAELAGSIAEGANASVELCISILGVIMLWCAVMEVMKASGLMNTVAKLLTPILGFLFPKAKKDPSVMQNISANVSANLLGLGNAATPAGIRAAEGLHALNGGSVASDDMCMLVIINTASLQLIPTTIGAIRASCGAANPFDIIPAVWFASICSLAAGIFAAKLLSKLYQR